MTETRAWLAQAHSDINAMDRLFEPGKPSSYCQSIAKAQQAVEKSVKALILGLRDARGVSVTVGWGHSVERFMTLLLSLPRAADNKDLQNRISATFDGNVRSGIRALDDLAPKRPAPGNEPARNTEYPFRHDGDWQFPAADQTFTRNDVARFRELAHRVFSSSSRLISLMERTA